MGYKKKYKLIDYWCISREVSPTSYKRKWLVGNPLETPLPCFEWREANNLPPSWAYRFDDAIVGEVMGMLEDMNIKGLEMVRGGRDLIEIEGVSNCPFNKQKTKKERG